MYNSFVSCLCGSIVCKLIFYKCVCVLELDSLRKMLLQQNATSSSSSIARRHSASHDNSKHTGGAVPVVRGSSEGDTHADIHQSSVASLLLEPSALSTFGDESLPSNSVLSVPMTSPMLSVASSSSTVISPSHQSSATSLLAGKPHRHARPSKRLNAQGHDHKPSENPSKSSQPRVIPSTGMEQLEEIEDSVDAHMSHEQRTQSYVHGSSRQAEEAAVHGKDGRQMKESGRQSSAGRLRNSNSRNHSRQSLDENELSLCKTLQSDSRFVYPDGASYVPAGTVIITLCSSFLFCC